MAQFASNLEKKHGKLATHNGNELSSQVFYRDSHTNPYIFVGFPSH